MTENTFFNDWTNRKIDFGRGPSSMWTLDRLYGEKNSQVDDERYYEYQCIGSAYGTFLCQNVMDSTSRGLNGDNRGYEGFRAQNFEKRGKGDLKEGFYLGKDLPLDDPQVVTRKFDKGPNKYPLEVDEPAKFRAVMDEYHEAMTSLAMGILRMLALTLELEESAFDAFCEHPIAILRLLHYPPQDPDSSDIERGIGAHTDFGGITILLQDTTGGLQVWNNVSSEWVDVTPVPGAYVVNLGNMMMRWTNDRYLSNLHRVINKSGKERFSVPFFLSGNPDYIVECLPTCIGAGPKYPPITLLLPTVDKRMITTSQDQQSICAALFYFTIFNLQYLDRELETDMSSKAIEAVLLTPELLEIILLHLDMTTLLVSAQRVSLIFKPIAPPVKPSLAYSTPPNTEMDSYPNPYSLEIVNSFNPLLEKHFGSVFFNLNGVGNYHRANYFYTNLPWWVNGRDNDHMKAELARRHRAFTRSGASWRRMLVSQPAPPALGYGWQEYGDWTTIYKALITENPQPAALSLDPVFPGEPVSPQPLPISQTGLRFGLLYDPLQYHAGHHQYPSLYFRLVWGRRYAPLLRDAMEHACRQLLEETSVIVQFFHRNNDLEHEPADVEAWDSAFRSEDFQHPHEQLEVVYRNPW
ncbi:2OG-Fe(II) oxygenase [Aspergillus oryzae]|uniref:2OG-Fe(II) oxygenase n=3 Tax=Aspergillus oryzae TaxID=5062 RepID=A0A1S9DAL2_ASPOZ|nr:2OG-Fe(II) oxygenase [Aspergillus oryzae]